jgi:Zn-finger nucleic acid-binding protein
MACPACFTMNFRESKFCARCGAPTVLWEASPGMLPCPGCETPLLKARVKDTELYQCGKCFGFWVDRNMVEHICRKAREESIPSTLADASAPNRRLEKVRYVRCPGCRKLMNRVNFSEYSGIVVDVCREHGTWFDARELQEVVRFIRNGGMEKARERKEAELAAARRKLRNVQPGASEDSIFQSASGAVSHPDSDLLPRVVRIVGGLFGR